MSVSASSSRANCAGVHADPHSLGLGQQAPVGAIQTSPAVVLAAILPAWPGHHHMRRTDPGQVTDLCRHRPEHQLTSGATAGPGTRAVQGSPDPVSYTHLRAHETDSY